MATRGATLTPVHCAPAWHGHALCPLAFDCLLPLIVDVAPLGKGCTITGVLIHVCLCVPRLSHVRNAAANDGDVVAAVSYGCRMCRSTRRRARRRASFWGFCRAGAPASCHVGLRKDVRARRIDDARREAARPTEPAAFDRHTHPPAPGASRQTPARATRNGPPDGDSSRLALPPRATLTRTDGLFKSCPGSRVSHRHMTWVTKPSVAVAHAQWRFNDQSDIILTLTGEQRSITQTRQAVSGQGRRLID